MPISVIVRDGMCSTIRAGGDGLVGAMVRPNILRATNIGPSNSVPIRNATRKTAGANILNMWGRAVPPLTHAPQRTPAPMGGSLSRVEAELSSSAFLPSECWRGYRWGGNLLVSFQRGDLVG